MTDNSWTSHRLLVLALLERHDEQIKECEDNYHAQREECQGRVAVLKSEITARIDSRFDALSHLHKDMVTKAKDELEESLKEPTAVTVAKITRRWEFWALAVTQVTAIAIALIALLK